MALYLLCRTLFSLIGPNFCLHGSILKCIYIGMVADYEVSFWSRFVIYLGVNNKPTNELTYVYLVSSLLTGFSWFSNMQWASLDTQRQQIPSWRSLLSRDLPCALQSVAVILQYSEHDCVPLVQLQSVHSFAFHLSLLACMTSFAKQLHCGCSTQADPFHNSPAAHAHPALQSAISQTWFGCWQVFSHGHCWKTRPFVHVSRKSTKPTVIILNSIMTRKW